MPTKPGLSDTNGSRAPAPEKVSLLAIAICIIVLPLFLWPGLTDYNYAKSILSLILIPLVLVIWSVSWWKMPGYSLRGHWLLLPLVALVAAGGLSLVSAQHVRIALQSLALLLVFLSFMWIVLNVVRRENDVLWLLGSLLAVGVVIAAYGLLQYLGLLAGPSGLRSSTSSAISTLGNKNHVGAFLLYLLFPSVILLLRARHVWLKAVILGAITFSYTMVLLLRQTGPRVVLAGVTIGLVVGWMIFRTRRPLRANRGWLIALLIAAIAIPGIVLIASRSDRAFITSTSLGELWERNSGDARTQDWWIGADLLLEHPITGVGLGHYKVVFFPSKVTFLQTERGGMHDTYLPIADQAHNEYVQVASEMGSIGVLALIAGLACLAGSLWRRLRAADEDRRADLLLITSGILSILVHGLISFPAHLVSSSMILVLLIGLALSSVYGDDLSFRVSLSKRSGRIVSVILGVVFLALGILAVRDAHANRLMESGYAHFQAGQFHESERLLTRSLALDFAPRQTYYYLAIAQIQLGKLSEATENLQKCLTRYVNEAVLLNYANVLINTGNSQRAIDPLAQLLASHPRNDIQRRATYLHAMAISQIGNPEEAIATIETLIEAHPTYDSAYYGLGGLLAGQGRIEEARAVYQRGLEIIEQELIKNRDKLATGSTSLSPEQIGRAQNRIARLVEQRALLQEQFRQLPR